MTMATPAKPHGARTRFVYFTLVGSCCTIQELLSQKLHQQARARQLRGEEGSHDTTHQMMRPHAETYSRTRRTILAAGTNHQIRHSLMGSQLPWQRSGSWRKLWRRTASATQSFAETVVSTRKAFITRCIHRSLANKTKPSQSFSP